MRAVPLRTIEQIDLQAFHRARQRLIEQRNGMISQIRGLLLDRGVPVAQGLYPLRTAVPMILEDAEHGLTPAFRQLMASLLAMGRQAEAAIEKLTEYLKSLSRESEVCRRLQSVPGTGPLVSTALISAVGNVSTFRSARHLSAWIGLVPCSAK